jgi:myo-inositol-1(or 4)-monophosphatase
MGLPDADWLGLCRRAAGAAREAVARFETTADRAVETGRGEGGDTTLVIDRAAEDSILAEFEGGGFPFTAAAVRSGWWSTRSTARSTPSAASPPHASR